MIVPIWLDFASAYRTSDSIRIEEADTYYGREVLLDQNTLLEKAILFLDKYGYSYSGIVNGYAIFNKK